MIAIAMVITVMVAMVVIGFIALHDPKPKPSTEMDDNDVKLYRDAARILNRLINVTDLSGDVSEDIVSERTRKQINEWVTAYKKALNK